MIRSITIRLIRKERGIDMKNKNKIIMLAALLLVLVFMLIASGFNSAWGSVEIKDVYYPNSEGGILHAQLFVPKGVSSANPAPAILNMHGGSDYLQTVSNYSIELARRGYVVLSVDAYGSGSSDFVSGSVASNAGAGAGGNSSALKMDGGATIGIEQLLSYKFVDSENIGLVGHSMGGTYIANAALEYADRIKAIMPWGSGSFVDMMKSRDSSEFTFNVGYINAQSDEMVYFATQEEAIKLLDNEQLKTFFGTDTTIEAGKVYGSFEDGTGRVIYTPKTTHIGNIISKDSIGAMVSYFGQAIPAGTTLSSTNQVWIYKELFCVLAIIALVIFVIYLGKVLLEAPAFAGLTRTTIPEVNIGKLPRIMGILICIAVPALTLHWVGLRLASKPATPLMPMNWANNLTWLTVINAAIILIFFLAWYFIAGKKQGNKLAAFGYAEENGKISAKGILKAFIFAICLITVMFAIVNLCYALFKIDFRFWQFGIMPLSVKRVAKVLPYFILFLIAFSITNTVSMAIAGVGKDGGKGSAIKQYLLNWVLGAAGFAIILIVYYAGLSTNNKPPFFLPYPPFATGHPNSLVYSMKTTVLVPTFTILSVTGTAFFRKTKNIYISNFITALIAALIIIGTNAFAR
jgi:dienelactone hydrolase